MACGVGPIGDDVNGGLRLVAGQLREGFCGRKASRDNAGAGGGSLVVVGLNGILVSHGVGQFGHEVRGQDLLDLMAQAEVLRVCVGWPCRRGPNAIAGHGSQAEAVGLVVG